MSRKWKDQRSPERTKVWIEPNKHRRVPVVYYLCRNGQLEHPHFVEVPLSSSDGLYLRDVIDRLISLRGKGMAGLYSWSSKRSYKNGFVWHDLSENDFIYPAHGQEYILKGSELFDCRDASFGSKSDEVLSSISKKSSSETQKSVDEFDLSVGRSKRNQSWSTIDLHEYKVYSGESSAVRIAADASTQTDGNSRRRRQMITEVEEEDKHSESYHDNEISELSRNEISPPPSDSSTETLESLMKSDGKLIVRSETDAENVDVNPTAGSKMTASSVLMQLISCGSISFRDCGPGKQNPGFSLVSKCKPKMLPRGEEVVDRMEEGAGEGTGENGVVLERKNRGKNVMVIEDKEYFSGSLIQTKKEEFPALKRSNSYNANG
ncbi:hypothetical protein L1987_04214 [Smallanthus sonchifolius]|uniref:Uncharacterized protein n=1 Tax=Smallanthus sonchifolius TaxID=185202 RepID=A0ACB9KCW7_9ASTR|nr:hypothetical protein L1987_04214 [Smallanthus sonchifolius]